MSRLPNINTDGDEFTAFESAGVPEASTEGAGDETTQTNADLSTASSDQKADDAVSVIKELQTSTDTDADELRNQFSSGEDDLRDFGTVPIVDEAQTTHREFQEKDNGVDPGVTSGFDFEAEAESTPEWSQQTNALHEESSLNHQADLMGSIPLEEKGTNENSKDETGIDPFAGLEVAASPMIMSSGYTDTMETVPKHGTTSVNNDDFQSVSQHVEIAVSEEDKGLRIDGTEPTKHEDVFDCFASADEAMENQSPDIPQEDEKDDESDELIAGNIADSISTNQVMDASELQPEIVDEDEDFGVLDSAEPVTSSQCLNTSRESQEEENNNSNDFAGANWDVAEVSDHVQPAPVLVDADNDDFGDFDGAAGDTAEVSNNDVQPGSELLDADNDDFGEFARTEPAALNQNSDALPEPQEEERNDGDDDYDVDDDFGDFGGADGDVAEGSDDLQPKPELCDGKFGGLDNSGPATPSQSLDALHEPQEEENISNSNDNFGDFGGAGGTAEVSDDVQLRPEVADTDDADFEGFDNSEPTAPNQSLNTVQESHKEEYNNSVDFGGAVGDTAEVSDDAQPDSKLVDADNDDFGGLNHAEPAALSQSLDALQEPQKEESNNNEDDDFGDFGGAGTDVAEMSDHVQPEPGFVMVGDHDFGGFESVEPDTPSHSLNVPQEQDNIINYDDGNDEFGDFGGAGADVAEAPGDGQLEPALGDDDNDEFGDFGGADAGVPEAPGDGQPKPAFVDDDDDDDNIDEFGDFGGADADGAEAPGVGQPEPALVEDDSNDKFGDFGGADGVQAEPVFVDTNGDFGEFDNAKPEVSSHNLNEPEGLQMKENNSMDDDDDFGDFGGASGDAAEELGEDGDDDFGGFDSADPARSSQNHPEQDDDDEFGDFDEADGKAPATSQNSHELSESGEFSDRARLRFQHLFGKYSREYETDTSAVPNIETISISSILKQELERTEGKVDSIDLWSVLCAPGEAITSTPFAFITSGSADHFSQHRYQSWISKFKTSNTPCSQESVFLPRDKTSVPQEVKADKMNEREEKKPSQASMPDDKQKHPSPPKETFVQVPSAVPRETIVKLPPVAPRDTIVQLPPAKASDTKTVKIDSKPSVSHSEHVTEFLKQIPDLSYMLSPKLSLPSS